MDVLVDIHVEDSSFYKARWKALTNARKPTQRYAASSAEDKVSIKSFETYDNDKNIIRLTGLLRRLCEFAAQLPLLVEDYTDEVLRKKHSKVGGRVEGTGSALATYNPCKSGRMKLL